MLMDVFQEKELQDEVRLALRAQDQMLLEARQTMEEELASTSRALEDERMAREADLKNTNQELNEALASVLSSPRSSSSLKKSVSSCASGPRQQNKSGMSRSRGTM